MAAPALKNATWSSVVNLALYDGTINYSQTALKSQLASRYLYQSAGAIIRSSAAPTRFGELLAYRQSLANFPKQITGNRSVDGVTALLEVNGRSYFGHNGWARRNGIAKADVLTRHSKAGFRPNGNSPFHAEGHVFDQALLAGEHGGNARLFVDSTFCDSCGSPFRGVENMAKALRLNRVEVFIRLRNGHVVSGILY